MDTNKIMVNEEVIEATGEIATAGSGNGIKMAAGIGLAVLGGVVAYKYLVKPMVVKIKAKKERKAMEEEFDNIITFKSEDDEIDE